MEKKSFFDGSTDTPEERKIFIYKTICFLLINVIFLVVGGKTFNSIIAFIFLVVFIILAPITYYMKQGKIENILTSIGAFCFIEFLIIYISIAIFFK